MSTQSPARSLINKTRKAFDSVIKEIKLKSNEQDSHIKCEATLTKNLSENSESGDESNKSFLLKKFLQNANEEYATNKELISKNARPIPKPRKNKNIFSQEVVNPSINNNSGSSQKTYVIEDVNARKSNVVEAVSVIVHNNTNSPNLSKSSRKNSSDLGKTYVKSISDTSKSSKEGNIALKKLDETPDNHISKADSKSCSEKSIKIKDTENNKEINTISKYNYEKIVEIIIHKADALQLDSYVTHPTVKVHVVDINTGKYYLKSDKNRSVVFYYENKEQDYILPVMTGSYNLQEKRTFSPEWEESILLNEDFSYLTSENIVMFFEVSDYVPFISKKFHSLQKDCYKGWHRITFAFLKLAGTDQSLSINKKVKLQLYYPKEIKQRDPSICDLWYMWKGNKLKKYPSALYITIREIAAPKKVIETFRSKTPLQIENISHRRKRSSQTIEIHDGNEILSKGEFRGSSDTFELPNKPLAELDSYDNGCFLLKFSNSGLYLACAVQIKEAFIIIIYEVNCFEEIHCTNEHRGLIYSINWSLDDTLLLTASADNTVVVWNFSTNCFLQILPHPIYVYTNQISGDNAIIATGCYDNIVRIWLFDKQEKKYKLHQEMERHKSYVTSVCFNKKSTRLYSSDSSGTIIEWSKLDNSDWQFERDISIPDLRHTVINEILLFPNEKKLLVHSRDSILRIISIKRACALHWLQGALNSRIQTFCSITSCGRYVTAGSENGLVVVWDAKTGKDIMSYEPFLNHLFLETVHCARFHPNENMIAFSHYGSICPILLYYYNATKEDTKQKNTSQYLCRNSETNLHMLNETSRTKEKIPFRDVLEKMDRLLK